MRGTRAAFWIGLVMIAAGVAWRVGAGGEEDFVAKVKAPRYRHENWRRRPLAYIDEAHGNSRTIDDGLHALTELARADGYTVRPNRRSFATGGLRGVNILVVAGGTMEESEITAAREWVEGGGGLLLIGAGAAAQGLGITSDLMERTIAFQGEERASEAWRGALVEVGKGRVAAFANAAPFLASAWNEAGGGDGQRFVLNVLHWLTGR